MAENIPEHAQEGEENMASASDNSDGLEKSGVSEKDKGYAKRMMARRRIEMMRDEKALEKQLIDLDWSEKGSIKSQ